MLELSSTDTLPTQVYAETLSPIWSISGLRLCATILEKSYNFEYNIKMQTKLSVTYPGSNATCKNVLCQTLFILESLLREDNTLPVIYFRQCRLNGLAIANLCSLRVNFYYTKDCLKHYLLKCIIKRYSQSKIKMNKYIPFDRRACTSLNNGDTTLDKK